MPNIETRGIESILDERLPQHLETKGFDNQTQERIHLNIRPVLQFIEEEYGFIPIASQDRDVQNVLCKFFRNNQYLFQGEQGELPLMVFKIQNSGSLNIYYNFVRNPVTYNLDREVYTEDLKNVKDIKAKIQTILS